MKICEDTMNINPTQMADWEIADHFEKNMLKISEIGKNSGLRKTNSYLSGIIWVKSIIKAFLKDIKIQKTANISP